MGCSPSKGSPWNDTKSPISESGVFVTSPVEPSNKLESDDRSISSESQMEIDEGERKFMIQNDASIDLQEGKKLPASKIATEVDTVITMASSQQVEVSEVPQEKQEYDLYTAESQGKAVGRRHRRSKGIRQTTQKDKENKASMNEQKVDLPEYMVKAHQAAYAYLNPSISKYEALLGLLDQAARTQLSLQPMVAFMVQRYEEVTHSLEEMATDGEEILKEHRDHLIWPGPMMDHNVSASVKPENQAPDLMQQLLQYSTERMHQVQDSTGGLGDSALEEASDYYLYLSKLLNEKLKAKKMAEGRLSQVIAHMEVAALQKFNPEDSALQSEDSGIGADNESLAGSEKHQRRHDSCEPAGTTAVKATGCHRDTPSSVQRGENASRQVGKVNTRPSLNILELLLIDKDQRGAEYPQGSEDEDENDDEEDEEKGEQKSGQRSNSLPADPSQFIHCLTTTSTENPQNIELPFKMKDTISGRSCFLPSQQSALSSREVDRTGVGSPPWREEDDWKATRPQTASASLNDKREMPLAGRQQRSQSIDSLHNRSKDSTLHQPEKRHRDLSCHMERMSKGEVGVEAKEMAILNFRRGPSVEVRKLLNPQAAVSNRLRSSLDRNFNILPSYERTGPKELSSRAQRVETEEKVEEKPKERMNGRGQLRASILPCPPALSEAEPPKMCRGRNSVKRLINTFSQRNDKQHQGSSNVQGSLKNTRTCGAPTTLGTGSGNAVPIIKGNNDNSCPVTARAANRPEDLNIDSLPPPPPEVLMDNSFESASRLFVGEGESRISSTGQSPVPGGSEVTQRLPSRSDLPHDSLGLSPVCSLRQDGEVGYQNEDAAFQLDSDQKSKEAATQYQQARKFTPPSHATDSPLGKAPVEIGPKTASVSNGNNASSIIKSTSLYPNIKPPTTPPVSRARLPPCTLSNWISSHNPPLWSQPTPPAHSKLPTSPPGQQRLLSSLKLRQEETWGSTCSLKAKCPPPSLLVERWARPSSPPQSFNDIHSAFEHTFPSPSEPPHTWTTSGSSAPPQPRATAICKLPVSMRGPQPFVKQNHSEHHRSTTPPSKRPERPIATMNQSCGNDPDISN